MKFIAFIIMVALFSFLLWLLVLIDVLRSDFTNPSNKTAWILVLLFIPPLGMILYFLYGYCQKRDVQPLDYKAPPKAYQPKDEDQDGWKL